MEDSIKNIITALLADDDSALKELFRAQVEDAVQLSHRQIKQLLEGISPLPVKRVNPA